jgi:hypothetical protein
MRANGVLDVDVLFTLQSSPNGDVDALKYLMGVHSVRGMYDVDEIRRRGAIR